MNLDEYFALRARGIELVRAVRGSSVPELQARGAAEGEARDLANLHEVYFGKTPYTGLQRTARETHHGVADLVLIERYVRRVKSKLDAWRLRAKLCRTAARDISRVANEQLKKLNPPKPARDGVRVTRGKDKWKLGITGPSRAIAEVWECLDGTLENFTQQFFNSTSRPEVTTNVIITLDELDQIARGDGDELVLKLFNGATMTGEEYVNSRLSKIGFAGLFHPMMGPVDCYRTERFANDKQRRLLSMENPTCAWPGCRRPATECQFHHIVAFKHGGCTNVSNMVPLCAFHNARNADDPFWVNRFGRMDRITGRTVWVPPYPGPPVPTGIYAQAPPLAGRT